MRRIQHIENRYRNSEGRPAEALLGMGLMGRHSGLADDKLDLGLTQWMPKGSSCGSGA